MRFRSLATFATLGALAFLPVGLAAQASARVNAPARPAALPLKYTAKATSASISSADLMSRLYVFADDSMQGREAGTIGHMKGTTYIAAQARRLGLKPAGDSGTFFQNVPFISRRFSSLTSLSANNRVFSSFSDFVAAPFRGAGARELNNVSAVYGGTVGDTANVITAEQAAGKLVVLRAPNGLGRLSPTNPLNQAAGIALIGDVQLTPQQLSLGRTASLTLKPAAGASRVPVTLLITSAMAQHLLGGAPDSLAVGAVGRTVIGNLIYDEADAPTRNVVAIIPGTDARLKGQYVAVGAHSDHVGFRVAGAVDHDSLHLYSTQRWFASENPSAAQRTADQQRELQSRLADIRVNLDSVRARRPARRDSINNGADDDGSGSVTVLEVAEAFARGKVKPKRSLLFVWHTAEEKGLLGSRYYTDNPTVARDSIVAHINLDMVGRGAASDLAAGSEKYLQLVGSRRLSTELGDLTETVNKSERVPFILDYSFDANGHPENIYCRSDHYSYARYGIPVVFMTTGLHGDYHQVSDEPQYIDYPHMARIGQFVFNLTNRIAGLDHRPVVDQPKPDPAGVCRQ